MKSTPSNPKLPSELMAKSDKRYSAAEYGDSFIRFHRKLTKWSYPAAAMVLIVCGLISKLTVIWVFIVGFMICFLFIIHVRGNLPRFRWSTDFRPPIFALRSHTDARTKEGEAIPPDDFVPTTGNNPYLFQLSMQLWDWGRVIMLMQEATSADLNVPAIVLKSSDQNWTQAMLGMAEHSWVVVMFPSITNGCIQEMLLLTERPGLLSKTVVFMPPSLGGSDKLIRNLMGFGGLPQRNMAGDWNIIAQELRKYGFELPDYQPQGMLYVPNEVFAVTKAVQLNHNDCSWKRLLELVSHPGIAKDHLWNILNYGMAYEASDRECRLGWIDTITNHVEPGSKIIHDNNGFFVSKSLTQA